MEFSSDCLYFTTEVERRARTALMVESGRTCRLVGWLVELKSALKVMIMCVK